MSKLSVVYSDSRRLAIRSRVKIASEILAPYWSIGSFVHHNPLHELEYLHFEEAIKRGQTLLGGRGYLENETYRRLFGQGRISLNRIDELLASISKSDSITLGDRTVADIDVYRARLLHDVIAPSSENLSRLLYRDKHREEILALANRLDSVLTEKSTVELDAQRVVTEDSIAITRNMMLSQWCDRVLGTKFTQFIDSELTKWIAAFVDEGQAAWEMPGREKTFYGVWRQLSLLAPAPHGIDSRAWRIALEALPENPEDCILEVLDDLGISEPQQEEYFALHLSALPGWSAFIKWRADHSGHQWQLVYPADLTQCLAIRLVYERQLVKAACRHRLGIEATCSAILSYMDSHPIVYLMLRQRVENKLKINLAQKVDRLWQRNNSITDWQSLAAQFVNDVNESYNEVVNCAGAWRLSTLANCLEVSIQDLLNCSPETLRTLLGWLEDFPESRHGLVWLKAAEASYQDKLLGQIAESIKADRELETNDVDGRQSEHRRPQCQAMFCIDVRSEPFRRNLEAVGRNETFGVAGFFLCFMRFQSLDSGHESNQFPVIMKARNIVREVPRSYENHKVERYRTGSELLRNARTLLHSLKEHFITPFVTVESLGWFYSLPLFLKTMAVLPYQSFSRGLRRLVQSPISTTLTIDKLSQASANEMVFSNQQSIIRRALQERFPLSGAAASAELIEVLQRSALNEEASGECVTAVKQSLPNLSVEEIQSFVEDLRHTYRISPRGASSHLERITRTGFTIEEQVFTIETALRMMGLTTDFARIVMVCAHGSTSENNPFESALDCGACGGNEGQANARAFAAMANKVQVRELLAQKGLMIPADTYFLPAQIDTTTDVVKLLDLEDVPTTHRLDLARLVADLEQASRQTSVERCSRFPELSSTLSPEQAANRVLERSADWSQVRPEWGLSGNASFIIARRQISSKVHLEGRAFLHSYDYLTDPGGKLLEVIMTAPQVVTQWINMEHYFSTVDNDVYGCGSKVYHNVAGQIGVMTGTESDLRTGLPWQTVMNGESPYHEPLRLTTLVEAPRSTIEAIIGRHELLKRFYHNEWVYLVALDREEEKFYRYSPSGEWLPIQAPLEERALLKQMRTASAS